MSYKISVVIVTYNSERHIYECLNSIFSNNDISTDLEVVIVDNCSEKSVELEKTLYNMYGNSIKFVRNNKNGGYGHGNNLGISVANAPFIMIMNPDVRLIEKNFGEVYEYFITHPLCAIYGMKQMIPGKRLGRSFDWCFRSSVLLGSLVYPICKILDIYWFKNMYIQGSCFYVNKKIFREIGMFDDNIFMYGEEDDIHDRLIATNKYSIHYNKRIVYQHHHQESKGFDFSYKTKERDLNSKIYCAVRDGLNESYAIIKSLSITRMYIARERVLSILGLGNKEFLLYMRGWKNILESKLNL